MKKLATISLLIFFTTLFAFGKRPIPNEMPEWESPPTSMLTPGLCTDIMLLDTTYAYDYINGNWQFVNMNVFSYTAAGQLIEEFQFKWISTTGIWENDKWYTYTYNNAGDMTLRYRYDWRPSLGIWENEYQYTNTYDASHRRTLSIRKDWDNTSSTWLNAVRYTYAYQGSTDLLTERVEQNWVLNNWQNDTRFTYTNNAQGLRIENAIYIWLVLTDSWALDSRYQYNYNSANCLILRTYQLWNGASWILDNKYEYSQNAQNYEVEWIKSLWNGSSYSLNARETSVYFLQNAAPTSTVLSNSTIQSSAPIGSMVGSFSTTDPDDNAFNYTLVSGLGGQDNAFFTISGNQLLTNASFANGTASQYFILVQVSDGNGGICQHSFVINVQYPVPVSITPAGPFCQSAGVQTLTASPAGGTWGGVANAQGQINPANLSPGPQIVTYTYTSPSGQTGSTTATIIILANPVVSINAIQPICASAGVQTLSASPAGGTWGGVANTQGQINPAALGVGSHPVSYSFTNGNGCSATATATVTILANPTVSINPIPPICASAGVQTLSASPAGGIWGGVANAQGQVNPANLGAGSYTVTYSFTNSNGCSNTANSTIIINPDPIVTLPMAGPFCANEGLQTLTASPAGGTWGGVASSLGQINPTALGVGSYTVSYTFTNANGCTGTNNISIIVNPLPIAAISGSGGACPGSGSIVPLTISATGTGSFTANFTINGNPQPPIFFASTPFALNATAPGNYLLTSITDGNGCSNTGTGQATVTEFGAPLVYNIAHYCSPDFTSYTISFEIQGGDPSSYSVNGTVGGTISNTAPYIFTSQPIPAGDGYSLTITDSNNCAPQVVSAPNIICGCTSSAGFMSQALVSTCGSGTVTVAPVTGQVLDPDDGLFYILHDGNGASLGNVLATSNSPQFSFAAPMQLGITYRVSAVVGNLSGGNLDFNDPCLAVAQGTPVVFRPLPTASLSGPSSTCMGDAANLVFALSGNAPFDVNYSDGNTIFALNNIPNGYQLPISLSSSTTFTLISVSDASAPACVTNLANAVTVEVDPVFNIIQTLEICNGESIVLAGAAQTQPGTYVDFFSSANGCDSTVTTQLLVNNLDTTYLSGTSCIPSQTGTFFTVLANQFGCDSLVVQTISYSSSDTTLLQSLSCDLQDVGVFTSIFTNQNGCDSVVIETVTLAQTDTTFINLQTCLPIEVGTNTSIFINSSGCDSVVVTTKILFAPPISLLATSGMDYSGFDVSCNGSSDGFATVSVINGGTAPFSYLWSEGQQSALASQLSAGTYTVTVTDANGCNGVSSVVLSQPPPLNINGLVDDFRCEMAVGGSIEVSGSGGVAPYLFSLNDGAYESSGIFEVSATGAYKIDIIDANACEASDVFVVNSQNFQLLLGPDAEIEVGDSVQVNIELVGLPLSYIETLEWSPTEGLLGCVGCIDQTLQPSETTTYTVTATAVDGCTTSSAITVTVNGEAEPISDGVYVPNAFSPNNDGLNDLLFVYASADVNEVESFEIFDRKGDKVFIYYNFVPNKPEIGWDGKFKGRPMNDGVFVWKAVVQYKDNQRKTLNGTVALLR